MIAVFLIAIFISNISPMSIVAEKEIAIPFSEDFVEPEIIEEAVELREEFTKYFLCDDGSYIATVCLDTDSRCCVD